MSPEAPKLEVVKARELSPLSGSLTVVAGPPGLGKSWFAGTMAEYFSPREVLVVATLPREVDSLQYQRHNLDTIVITDEDWRPKDKVLKATGYDKMLDVLTALRRDTQYKGIVWDNGTESAELAWRSAMAPLGVADPSELGTGSNRYAPYTSLDEKMKQFVRSLSLLTGKNPGLVAQPKVIIMPWHVQPAKEAIKDGDESADEKGRGAEYEGDYLPMVRGAFRRRLAALVDNFVYADLVRVTGRNALSESEMHFCVQLVSDKERHVKTVGEVDAKKLLKGMYLDVHGRHDAYRQFAALLEQPKEIK